MITKNQQRLKDCIKYQSVDGDEIGAALLAAKLIRAIAISDYEEWKKQQPLCMKTEGQISGNANLFDTTV